MATTKLIQVDLEILKSAVSAIQKQHPDWATSEDWLQHLIGLVDQNLAATPSQELDLSKLFSIYKEIGESELAVRIASEIEVLRVAYRKNPAQFSAEAVEELQVINSYVQTASDFALELEDMNRIVDKNDADDLLERFEKLALQVDEQSRLFLRIKKEIRELLERRQNLPSGAARQTSRKLAQARFTLEAKRKRCDHKSCDSMLTLREGNGSYFWGCKKFPECWGRRSLTKEERKLIET